MALLEHLKVDPGSIRFQFDVGQELRSTLRFTNFSDQTLVIRLTPGTARAYTIVDGGMLLLPPNSLEEKSVLCAAFDKKPFWFPADFFTLECFLANSIQEVELGRDVVPIGRRQLQVAFNERPGGNSMPALFSSSQSGHMRALGLPGAFSADDRAQAEVYEAMKQTLKESQEKLMERDDTIRALREVLAALGPKLKAREDELEEYEVHVCELKQRLLMAEKKVNELQTALAMTPDRMKAALEEAREREASLEGKCRMLEGECERSRTAILAAQQQADSLTRTLRVMEIEKLKADRERSQQVRSVRAEKVELEHEIARLKDALKAAGGHLSSPDRPEPPRRRLSSQLSPHVPSRPGFPSSASLSSADTPDREGRRSFTRSSSRSSQDLEGREGLGSVDESSQGDRDEMFETRSVESVEEGSERGGGRRGERGLEEMVGADGEIAEGGASSKEPSLILLLTSPFPLHIFPSPQPPSPQPPSPHPPSPHPPSLPSARSLHPQAAREGEEARQQAVAWQQRCAMVQEELQQRRSEAGFLRGEVSRLRALLQERAKSGVSSPGAAAVGAAAAVAATPESAAATAGETGLAETQGQPPDAGREGGPGTAGAARRSNGDNHREAGEQGEAGQGWAEPEVAAAGTGYADGSTSFPGASTTSSSHVMESGLGEAGEGAMEAERQQLRIAVRDRDEVVRRLERDAQELRYANEEATTQLATYRQLIDSISSSSPSRSHQVRSLRHTPPPLSPVPWAVGLLALAVGFGCGLWAVRPHHPSFPTPPHHPSFPAPPHHPSCSFHPSPPPPPTTPTPNSSTWTWSVSGRSSASLHIDVERERAQQRILQQRVEQLAQQVQGGRHDMDGLGQALKAAREDVAEKDVRIRELVKQLQHCEALKAGRETLQQAERVAREDVIDVKQATPLFEGCGREGQSSTPSSRKTSCCLSSPTLPSPSSPPVPLLPLFRLFSPPSSPFPTFSPPVASLQMSAASQQQKLQQAVRAAREEVEEKEDEIQVLVEKVRSMEPQEVGRFFCGLKKEPYIGVLLEKKETYGEAGGEGGLGVVDWKKGWWVVRKCGGLHKDGAHGIRPHNVWRGRGGGGLLFSCVSCPVPLSPPCPPLINQHPIPHSPFNPSPQPLSLAPLHPSPSPLPPSLSISSPSIPPCPHPLQVATLLIPLHPSVLPRPYPSPCPAQGGEERGRVQQQQQQQQQQAEQECHSLRQENEALRNENEGLRQENENLRQEVEGMKEDAQRAGQEGEELRQAVQGAREEVEEKEERIRALQDRLERIEMQEEESGLQDMLAALQASVRDKEETLRSLKTALALSDARAKDAGSQLEPLKLELQQLRLQMDEQQAAREEELRLMAARMPSLHLTLHVVPTPFSPVSPPPSPFLPHMLSFPANLVASLWCA
ncbi:unnamed protein product [Closterium sp. NIES-53]